MERVVKMGFFKKSLPIATPQQITLIKKSRDRSKAAAKLGVKLPPPTKAQLKKLEKASSPAKYAKLINDLAVEAPSVAEMQHNVTQSGEYIAAGRYKGSGRYSSRANPHLAAAQAKKEADKWWKN